MAIRKINGIGPSTALVLDCYGIRICRDLYEKKEMIYLLETQNTFKFLMNACRGLGANRIEHDGEKRAWDMKRNFSNYSRKTN